MAGLGTDNQTLKDLLAKKDPAFWQGLSARTIKANTFEDLFFLSTLRRKALAKGFEKPAYTEQKIRLAIIGACTFYPLNELIEHILFFNYFQAEIWTGEYDNYAWEIMNESSDLYSFKPDFVLFLPPARRYKYQGNLSDANSLVEQQVTHSRNEILDFCETVHKKSGAELLLCNFILPCDHDPGSFRTRSLTSAWSSLKLLNLELGLHAASSVHICDLEFLAARDGGMKVRNDRGWFESRLPFSPDFSCTVAKEVAHLVNAVREPSKKVLVMDLDGTLWGGTIGDDGLNGIEIGDTSPRGQCFKEFQHAIKDLSDRGVLLAVCSKNDLNNALEPFERHPEMILRRNDFASFKANWNPKSDNMLEIAQELNLSLDSFVFVDDNPAEIEIIRQFAPAVTLLQLGSDPAEYVQQLKDCRLFEPRQITEEDVSRTLQYKQDLKRQEMLSTATDMESYLTSLQMEAHINEFREIDVPRITQLINKSNQFNLTTKRRSEAEIVDLINSKSICLSLRLKDRLSDIGLISVVIANPVDNSTLSIDTWLMSCRVLKRQVEHLLMNELMHRAKACDYSRVVAKYIPSAKNQMVKDFYEIMGFKTVSKSSEFIEYEVDVASFKPFSTKIKIVRGNND